MAGFYLREILRFLSLGIYSIRITVSFKIWNNTVGAVLLAGAWWWGKDEW